MAGYNSVPSFLTPRAAELLAAAGITQFPSEFNWWQTIGGLFVQGGKVVGVSYPGPTVVPFNVGFPTQCLGVFCQEIGTNAHSWAVNNVTTAQFDLILSSGPAKDFYWWAIGV